MYTVFWNGMLISRQYVRARVREIGSFTRYSTSPGSIGRRFRTLSNGFGAKNRNGTTFGRGRDDENRSKSLKIAAGAQRSFVFIDKYCIYRVVDSFTTLSPITSRCRRRFYVVCFHFYPPPPDPERNAHKTVQTRHIQNGNNFISCSPPPPPLPSFPRSCVDDDIIIIPHAPLLPLEHALRPPVALRVRTHDRTRSLHNRNVIHTGVIQLWTTNVSNAWNAMQSASAIRTGSVRKCKHRRRRRLWFAQKYIMKREKNNNRDVYRRKRQSDKIDRIACRGLTSERISFVPTISPGGTQTVDPDGLFVDSIKTPRFHLKAIEKKRRGVFFSNWHYLFLNFFLLKTVAILRVFVAVCAKPLGYFGTIHSSTVTGRKSIRENDSAGKKITCSRITPLFRLE